MNIDEFIFRWKDSGGAERANYQMFLSELAELIGCDKPKPKDARQHELISGESRPVQTKAGTAKRRTQAWSREMEKARRQAELLEDGRYAA